MSCCNECFFYKSGYLWNGCAYFDTECFYEPVECVAFSPDGNLTEAQERRIYEATDGNFGEKKGADMIEKSCGNCVNCEKFDTFWDCEEYGFYHGYPGPAEVTPPHDKGCELWTDDPARRNTWERMV